MGSDLCSDCGRPRHWCERCGELETGHYGTTPAKFCDECRYDNIMNLGMAGDEPPGQVPKFNDTEH